MKLTSSYAVEIKHINKLFRQTIKIYNDAEVDDELDKYFNEDGVIEFKSGTLSDLNK